ncbi:hypothetical protein OSTOST_16711, partial [Ostertagia ostertagi]
NLACYKVLAKNNIIPEKFRNEFLAWQATHCDSSGRKLDSLEDEEAEGRVTLDSLLEVLNQQAVESDDAYDEVYLTEQKWDISKRGSVEKNVILLANRTKGYCQKSMGKANIAVDKVLVNECSEAQEPIVRVNPMSSEEAADVKYVFSLTKQRRWELYMLWMQQ